MIIVTGAFVALTYFEMHRYEDGIIDVCATQQDSYVQLVIDQINLKENRSDQEIIENILSTLDSSSNRYWTFSKEQTMLYVKDALETNRYQSLTARSYYTSESADNFFEGLIENKVQHERIILDNKDYIASGALFRYNDQDYRICLLTNTTVLLDNNKFLGSKMELIIIFIVVYSLIFIFPIAMAILNNIVQKKNNATNEELRDVNLTVERLNERLTTNEIYDNRLNLFSLPTINLFLDEYRSVSKAFPISFIAFRYSDKETVSKFFGHNCVLLGKRDLKFYDGKEHLALIMCIKCDNKTAKSIQSKIKADAECLGVETAVSRPALDRTVNKIMDKMGNPVLTTNDTGKVMRPDSRTESRYRTKTTEESK
jgi:hypothetical protein